MSANATTRLAPLQPVLAPDTTVKVLGLGGVGGIVARYVAIFLASLRCDLRLLLIDGDRFEDSNATRMMFRECGNKAAVLCRELQPQFRHTSLLVSAVEEYVTAGNIARLIHPGDVVFATVDNHATRKLVNDHCAGLDEVCLISGGNDGVEDAPGDGGTGRPKRGTFGNAQIYLRRGGADLTPSLTQHHPEIAHPADRNPAELDCTAGLVSTPQLLFANLTVATAMLNSFFLQCCGALHYPEILFDIERGRMIPVDYGAPGEKSGVAGG